MHADRIKSQNVNAFRYIERFQYHEHYSTIISNDYKHIFRNVSLVSSQNLTYIFYGTSLLHVLCFDRDYIDPNNITENGIYDPFAECIHSLICIVSQSAC